MTITRVRFKKRIFTNILNRFSLTLIQKFHRQYVVDQMRMLISLKGFVFLKQLFTSKKKLKLKYINKYIYSSIAINNNNNNKLQMLLL